MKNGRVLFIASAVLQEPTLLWIETRIQAPDNVPGETIVDPRAIIFAKDEPSSP